MSRTEKLIAQLLLGKRLSLDEVRTLLSGMGYVLLRRKGSHEQWIRGGRTFTLACHSKEVPHYILDSLKEMAEANEKNQGK